MKSKTIHSYLSWEKMMEVKLLATIQMTKSKNNVTLIYFFSDVEIIFFSYSNSFSCLEIEDVQDVQVQLDSYSLGQENIDKIQKSLHLASEV